MLNLRRSCFLYVLALSAAACSQHASSPGPLPATSAQNAVRAQATVTFSVFVPATGNGAKARSMKIAPSGATSAVSHDLTATTPGCATVTGGIQCTIPVPASVGTTTFTITSYDATGETGNTLATVALTLAVASAQTVALTLQTTAASTLAVALTGTPPPEGARSTQSVSVMAEDAKAEYLVGPDPYANPIALSDTDASGTTSLSAVSVTQPSTGVTLTYSGKPLSSAGANARIAASATGVASAATTYFVTAQQQWTTWGGAPNRNMYNPLETTISKANVGSLRQVWSATASGVFTAAPIVAANVPTSSGPFDVLYTGDEHGVLYALNAGTGAPIWSKTLLTQTIDPSNPSTPGCRDLPGGVYGISESPVVDPSTSRVYVVDALGMLYGLDLGTGAAQAGPVQLYPYENGVNITNVYGGLNLDPVNGVIYIPRGAHCGLRNYGGVTRYTTATGAIAQFYTESVTTQGVPNVYGGIWGPGGVTMDPRFAGNPLLSDIYAATGDGNNTPPKYGESVIRLSEQLNVVGHSNPGGICCNDLDFGDTPLVFQSSSCGKTLLVAIQKTGVMYLFDADNITAGPLEQIQIGTSTSSGTNIGTAAYDPLTNLVYVANGSDSSNLATRIRHGLLAFRFNATCHLGLAWQYVTGPNNALDGPPAPPSIANGIVFYADGPGSGCSPIGQPHCVPGMTDFYGFDASTGAVLLHRLIKGPIFTTPVVVNGHVYLESWNAFGPGIIYAFGL